MHVVCRPNLWIDIYDDGVHDDDRHYSGYVRGLRRRHAVHFHRLRPGSLRLAREQHRVQPGAAPSTISAAPLAAASETPSAQPAAAAESTSAAETSAPKPASAQPVAATAHIAATAPAASFPAPAPIAASIRPQLPGRLCARIGSVPRERNSIEGMAGHIQRIRQSMV